MYVILAYDINAKRIPNINKYLKRYLNWRQNSLFEGELSQAQLVEIENKIMELIDVNEDTITIYVLPSKKFLREITIGARKGESDIIM